MGASRVGWDSDALAFVRTLSGKIQRQILKRADDLFDDPYPQVSLKLHNMFASGLPLYRVRQGDYRILYTVEGVRDVTIREVDNRKDVYRR